MRFGLSLFKGRSAQSEKKVPLRILTPVALKDTVSSKGIRMMESGCIQELSVFLTCLRENEFENSRCAKEFASFKKCNDSYLASARSLKLTRQKEVPEPYSKVLTNKQVGYFLKKYYIR